MKSYRLHFGKSQSDKLVLQSVCVFEALIFQGCGYTLIVCVAVIFSSKPDNITDSAAKGKPSKLKKRVIMCACVFYLADLHRTDFTRHISRVEFQIVGDE